jgi:thiol-disulfide isomerase/thioredoxin
MKKTTIIIVMAMLCLNFWSKAQGPTALKVGEKIPKQIWEQKMPAINKIGVNADSLSLNEYTGKIIVLDFWATWCTSCFHKFETIQNFQQQYRDKIQFLLVDTKSTKDTPQRIKELLNGETPFVKKYNLTTTYNDTLLNSLFPHKFIPHYVWIGSNGNLLAITNSSLLNQHTIEAIITSEAESKKISDTAKNDKP